ncbi:MAG: peroxiredoxin [Rhodospirillales bacterium]
MNHKTIGDSVPNVTFRTRQNGEWMEVSSDTVFKGRTVVVFAIPGAFTPTCSSTHLPGFLALEPELKEAGVDDIYCLSVNDSFVMNAWAKDQDAEGIIKMLPDGSGHFSRGMGLLVDRDDLGFGYRSWRYAMLVVDGVIRELFVEDFNAKGDPFQVSDADTMLSAVEKQRRAA